MKNSEIELELVLLREFMNDLAKSSLELCQALAERLDKIEQAQSALEANQKDLMDLGWFEKKYQRKDANDARTIELPCNEFAQMRAQVIVLNEGRKGVPFLVETSVNDENHTVRFGSVTFVRGRK